MGLRQFIQELFVERNDSPALTPTALQQVKHHLNRDNLQLSEETQNQLTRELTVALQKGGSTLGFRMAANALKRGDYEAAIFLYRQVGKLCPTLRQDCEGQVGLTQYCQGKYRQAIESYVAARVHGADPAWMDETIWEACETLYRLETSVRAQRESLETYLRLCPGGAYTTEARGELATLHN